MALKQSGGRQRWSFVCFLLHRFLSVDVCLGFLQGQTQRLSQRATRTGSSRPLSSPHGGTAVATVVVVVGGDLAGVTAALTIAEQQQQKQDCQVWLLTGHDHILKGINTENNTPILPAISHQNSELIQRYGSGGREMAGILAKHCSPLQAKEWLEEQRIVLQEESSSDDIISTLLKEKPLFVSPECNLRDVLQENLERANVNVLCNAAIQDISSNNNLFAIEVVGSDNLQADILILADDYRDGNQEPILAAAANDNDGRKQGKGQSLSFDFDDDEEPMSLKDQMLLKKKQRRQDKKQTMEDMVNDDDVNFKALSKQDQQILANKRKKEVKQQKKQLKKRTSLSIYYDDDDDSSDSARTDTDAVAQTKVDMSNSDAVPAAAPSTTTLNSLMLAKKLGHTIVDESPGMFDFLVPTQGVLEGCVKAVIVPKARLRCKVETPPAKRKKKDGKASNNSRLPKVEGPLVISQGKVSGPGALRLSTLIAHEMVESGHRGTLQIHFAPDIGGVEDLTQVLMETVDPSASVLDSPCPLAHREIDYDDYDYETGNFMTVELPLVPNELWSNLCQQAGIKLSSLKWKDVPRNSVQSLARLLVDCPLTITGIRPKDNILAGGVSLREVDMAGCESRKVDGLFLCGSSLDLHGFDGGFNPLLSIATGRVAGSCAGKCLNK